VTGPLAIQAEGVTKTFGDHVAVDGAGVEVARGQLVALLGPSGSGKTTLLRVIAGFERPDAGTVRIGGRLVAGEGAWEEPDRRRVGMVFQDGALFPHLSVGDNVGFARTRPGRVEECLELVGLAHRSRSYPDELSGGERQRVALARAMAADPEVVLLDEPFGSLDAGLRAALREELAAILRAAGASALLVTHDQQEALSLADSVSLMRAGKIVQVGCPEEIYGRPASRWAAEFLGDVDVVPGTAERGAVTCELGRFPVEAATSGAVEVLVRPEAVGLGAPGGNSPVAAGRTPVPATVVGRSYYGPDQLVVLRLGSGRTLRSRRPGFVPWQVGEVVDVWLDGPVTVLRAGPR
jgi:iron(III) transport system ATP-binding protein